MVCKAVVSETALSVIVAVRVKESSERGTPSSVLAMLNTPTDVGVVSEIMP